VRFFLVGPLASEMRATFRGTLDIRCETCARSTVRPIEIVGSELRAWLANNNICCRECGEAVTRPPKSAPVRSGDGQ
jgi:ribosomal protein S27E